MVVKLEPGAYLDRYGGVRTADLVAVTEKGADVLTLFQWNLADLTLDG
jgi:Xaa-Pro aminopeptidase